MRIRPKKAIFPLFFTMIILLVICLTGCGEIDKNSTKKVSHTGFYLDTVVTVSTYGYEDTGIIDECLKLCSEYELIFSRTDERSELYRLNDCGSMEVSDHLLSVLKTALEYCRISDGRFDISMGAISAMYNFSSESPSLPSPEALESALAHVDYNNIIIDGNHVTFSDPETVIDLGSIAKGYIADQLKSFLLDNGIEHAIIDLGGNILCVGGKPDGSNFRVGIQYPDKNSSKPITTVPLSDLSVVTSGAYQRFFESDGRIYHHILDPETGMSVENDLLSVTIISASSTRCDALSTVCFALGLEEGLAMINGMDDTWAVFVTDDMEIHYSDGFEEKFA